MEVPLILAAQARLYASDLEVLHAPGSAGPAGRFRMLRALDQLDELGAAFSTDRINWVLVKGAGLSLSVWPDPFARSFSDLDVFVSPSHFGASVLALSRLGYRADAVPDASQVHWTFHREASRPVELHHVFSREFDSPRPLVERFVATGAPLKSGETGQWLRVPDPVAHLAYVLLHAYNHGWQLSPNWALDAFFLLSCHPDILAPALTFFPRDWPVILSLHVAALVVPALADRLEKSPPLTLWERALLRRIASRLQGEGLSLIDSAVLRIGASASPLATLLSMVARRA